VLIGLSESDTVSDFVLDCPVSTVNMHLLYFGIYYLRLLFYLFY
jgi:hypothetical protein